MAMDLGKQVGPLPLGAWIAVVGGGLGLAYYSYRNQAASPAASDSEVAQANSVGDGSVGGWQSTSPTQTDTTPVIETNESWGRQAINWLIAQGYDASESDSAIRKYLAGNDPAPSVKEYVLQGLALAHFGAPPNALPPSLNPPPVLGGEVITPPVDKPPVNNPPAPPPVSSPSNVRWDTVQPWPAKKSTLWGLAEVYYGNGQQYSRIYNANRTGVRRPDGSMGMISNPNLVKAGWRLVIP